MIWAVANKSTVKLASCVYDGRNLVAIATALECFSIKKKKKKFLLSIIKVDQYIMDIGEKIREKWNMVGNKSC